MEKVLELHRFTVWAFFSFNHSAKRGECAQKDPWQDSFLEKLLTGFQLSTITNMSSNRAFKKKRRQSTSTCLEVLKWIIVRMNIKCRGGGSGAEEGQLPHWWAGTVIKASSDIRVTSTFCSVEKHKEEQSKHKKHESKENPMVPHLSWGYVSKNDPWSIKSVQWEYRCFRL